MTKTRGQHCPMCGQFARRAMRLREDAPTERQVAHARILSLEAQVTDLEHRNEALSKVAAVQAHRLVALAETIDSYEPRGRQRAG